MKKINFLFALLLYLILNNLCVAAVDSLTVTQQTSATTINLTTTQTNLSLATLSVGTTGAASNQKTYNINITSQNGGLKNSNAIAKGASAGSATIPYTLNWGVGAVAVTSSTIITVNSTATQTIATKLDKTGGSNLDGRIEFSRTGTPGANLFSGTYTDVLTVTSANITNGTSITKTFNLSSAVVADTITLTITPTASASNLALNASQSLLNVGTVSITANCQNGYTLSLSSANSRWLVNTAAGASPLANEKIAYTLYYQGSQISAAPTPTTVATSSSATLLTSTTQIGNVSISYTGVTPSLMRAGTYQDYLTFVLQSQ